MTCHNTLAVPADTAERHNKLAAEVQLVEVILLGGGDAQFSGRNVSTYKRPTSLCLLQDTLNRISRNVGKFLGNVPAQYSSTYLISKKVRQLCVAVQQITITTRPYGAAWWCTCKLNSGYATSRKQTTFG